MRCLRIVCGLRIRDSVADLDFPLPLIELIERWALFCDSEVENRDVAGVLLFQPRKNDQSKRKGSYLNSLHLQLLRRPEEPDVSVGPATADEEAGRKRQCHEGELCGYRIPFHESGPM